MSPIAGSTAHQSLKDQRHGGQLGPDLGRHVGLAEDLPLAALAHGTILHSIGLSPQHQAAPVNIVDSDIAITQLGRHSYPLDLDRPLLSSKIRECCGLE